MWSLLIFSVSWAFYYAFLRPPAAPKRIKVTIPQGYNTTQIANLLAAKGVISNSYTFRAYAALSQTELNLQPGFYTFTTDMTYYEIIKKLTQGQKQETITVVVPEGFTVKEIVARLAKKTGRPKEDFYEYTLGQGVPQLKPPDIPPDVNSLEGYLFPKTYTFVKKEHPAKIIKRMVTQFAQETAGLDWSFAQNKGLSRHQIITVASLIEKEAKVPEERPLIAAVIYNRLTKNMPLQIDATVQYALPERKEILTNEDLKIASPYNTYQQLGLPPGPIANPGLESIKAALAPAPVDYLYYVLTSADGRHTFTNNYQEFLKAKKQAQGE